MYILLVYDVEEKRVAKACKFCRRYLQWVQNSVFEGELTDAKLARLKAGLDKIINKDEDSVLMYKFRTEDAFKKEVMGLEKNPTDNLI